jgi:hypothetical protein
MTPLHLALAGLFAFVAVVNLVQCAANARERKHVQAVCNFASGLGNIGAALAFVGIAFLSGN